MTKFFSIAAAGLTPEQEKMLADEWKSYSWWHGVANFWLLRDHTDEISANRLRDNIQQIAPGARVMVVQVEPTTWSSLSITEANRDWLRKFWPPEGK